MITASATIDLQEAERRSAIAALRSKYPQYLRLLPDDAPVIRVTPLRVSSWGNMDEDD